MNWQTFLIYLVMVTASFSFLRSAGNMFQTSQLPEEMPEKTDIRFSRYGGMSRSYTKILVSDGVLQFEEFRSSWKTPKKWSAQITREDQRKLYRAFVENKFDLIKNDKREHIVYDAGSENIQLSLNNKTYNAISGKNSPMSGLSLERYRAVSEAIQNLVKQYEGKGESVADNFVIIEYNQQSHHWIFKTATPLELTKSEIAEVETLLTNAIADYNSKQKSNPINLAEYKRQYLPVINEKGEKEVWVNCFCNDFENWREEIVMVADGGKCFFNLNVNLTAKKHHSIMVNGEA